MQKLETLRHMPRNMWRSWERVNFPLDGLVFYVPLWHPELTGATIISKDLNAHVCTVNGAIWGLTGRILDGLDDKISCGDASSIQNLAEFTWLVWVKITTFVTVRRIMDKGVKNIYLAGVSANQFYTWIGAGTTAGDSLTNTTYLTGTPYLIAVTYSNSGDRKPYIYVNGELPSQTQIAAVGTISADAGTNLILGNRAAGDRWITGTIGEARIYNRALGAAEIKQIYLATKWKYQ